MRVEQKNFQSFSFLRRLWRQWVVNFRLMKIYSIFFCTFFAFCPPFACKNGRIFFPEINMRNSFDFFLLFFSCTFWVSLEAYSFARAYDVSCLQCKQNHYSRKRSSFTNTTHTCKQIIIISVNLDYTLNILR